MTDKQKQLLARQFTPPPSTRKNEFLATLPRENASYGAVLLVQVGYLRKRIWFGCFACVALAILFTYQYSIQSQLLCGLSALMPIFSLCIVSELYRSVAYRMDEMELACRYNLPYLLLMRLTILGSVNFVFFVLMALIAGQNGFGLLRNLIYLGVPALLSLNGSLFLLSHLKTRDTLYPCTAVSGGVSLLTWFAFSEQAELLLSTDTISIWVIGFMVLVWLMLQNVYHLKTNMEEYTWNFA